MGAVARYMTFLAAERVAGIGFPYGTFAANVAGSFLIGIAFIVLVKNGREPSQFAPFAMVGFLGGYTTFSTYALDFWQLIDDGRVEAATVYAVGSAISAILALVAGIAVAKTILN